MNKICDYYYEIKKIIVHHDIKPDNILVNFDHNSENFEILIIDFGGAINKIGAEHSTKRL